MPSIAASRGPQKDFHERTRIVLELIGLLDESARLFVRDRGQGAPVLLLPGWAMTSDLRATVTLRLDKAGLRAISYDRRGHGRFDDPGPMDHDALADDIAARAR